MTELGALLVLLHGARERVSTVRAVVHTWRHLQLAHEAMARAARAAGGGFSAYGSLDEPQPQAFESRIRLWLAPPDRAREEVEHPSGGWDPALFRAGVVGADELRLEIDAEPGALLDEAFPEDTFAFRPPPGEEVRSLSLQFPVHDLAIEQAVPVFRGPTESWQPTRARLELGGTRILIQSSDLDVDALADVAAGPVPAPAEPPDLRGR